MGNHCRNLKWSMFIEDTDSLIGSPSYAAGSKRLVPVTKVMWYGGPRTYASARDDSSFDDRLELLEMPADISGGPVAGPAFRTL